jgi:hypothetical protein
MRRRVIAPAAVLGLWWVLCAVAPAAAAEIDPADLTPTCEDPFEFKGGICQPKPAVVAAIEDEKKCQGPALKWTADAPVKCAAVAGSAPKPVCDTRVVGLRFKDKKCVLLTTPEDEAKTDFFANWAVGVAVLMPNVKTITDASVVDNKVRVHGEIRQESAMLVAKHFYPWNPGRRCVLRGTFATEEKDRNTLLGGTAGFLNNCTGLMVAAAMPTSGAVNGQVINFLGVGLAVGGGVRDSKDFNWHFGIGVGRKFNARTLGDGWVEGQAPPAGETQVRFKSIDVPTRFVYFTIHW